MQPNVFLAYLTENLNEGEAVTTIGIDRVTTLTGEAIATADFALFGRGVLTIKPDADGLSSFLEFASFTGVDAVDPFNVTGVTRGLSAKSNVSSADRMHYYPVGTPVVISFGSHTIQDIIDYCNALFLGTVGNASATVAGVAKLSKAPVAPTIPIAVGDNDPRLLPNAYAADAGANDTYVISLTTAPSAYAIGQEYVFKANTTNTGPATLNVNGLGAKTIVHSDGVTALVDNEIIAGEVIRVFYDGTNFRFLKSAYPTDYQAFTASGTWTKPSGLSGNEMMIVHGWGAGAAGAGSGTCGGGAGGGAFSEWRGKVSQAGATETVTIGAGGATLAAVGGNSSFGSLLTAYGGGSPAGAANVGGGGGGGGGLAAGGAASTSTGGTGGGPGGSAASTGNSGYGGAGGGTQTNGGDSARGGGGGAGVPASASNPSNGGNSIWGGGGGGAGMTAASGNTVGAGGTSKYGGNGGQGAKTGAAGAGVAPGGGGGGGSDAGAFGAGARGEIRVWVIRT